jgi:hypothetical protein
MPTYFCRRLTQLCTKQFVESVLVVFVVFGVKVPEIIVHCVDLLSLLL